MKIRFFVRTTEQRIFEYDLEYEKLVDKRHLPVTSFIEQLKYISEWDSVLLEDDLILCKDFKKKIEEVINEYPDKIINFFTKPKDWFTTHESIHFVYNQCTYYPKGISLKVAEEMEKMRMKFPRLQYDILESNALLSLGISHVQYRPCLVQHLDNNSLVGNTAKGYRRTPYFIDYLEELNIDYSSSFKEENRNKLENLLFSKKF
jgi:hypothetical protein